MVSGNDSWDTFVFVVFKSNDPEELKKRQMVVNKDVLVVLSMSVVNNFNCVQGCGEGTGVDSDWLFPMPPKLQ